MFAKDMQVQVLFPAPKNERHEAFVLSVSHAAIGPCRRQSAGSFFPCFPMNRCEQQGRKKRRFPDETAGHDCQGKKRCSAEAAPTERNRSSMRSKVVLRNLLQRRGAVDAFVDEFVCMMKRGIDNPNTSSRIRSPGRRIHQNRAYRLEIEFKSIYRYDERRLV